MGILFLIRATSNRILNYFKLLFKKKTQKRDYNLFFGTFEKRILASTVIFTKIDRLNKGSFEIICFVKINKCPPYLSFINKNKKGHGKKCLYF